ncbi:hypothetical protein [Fusobacterium ulcerans]|uniref:Uncharacterized protein n=1 Tax=Fusobacterium ulcerans 12-1B TaxID=457404 RepID=H1PQK8_9FUSO|nr:hypothetical protein [Fusobacterium ulcerans]EHO83683.1 hypothetical protein HMPREF0402_00701 [Fusobacterium ulcerans 12-1B]
MLKTIQLFITTNLSYFILILMLYIFALINYKIQKIVVYNLLKFLSDFSVDFSWLIFINQADFFSSATEKDLKLYYKKINLLSKNTPKLKLIGEEKISHSFKEINDVLARMKTRERVEKVKAEKIKLKIIEIIGVLEREMKFSRKFFAPHNLICNLIDIFIFMFLDYEKLFLKSQIIRIKSVTSKITFATYVSYAAFDFIKLNFLKSL